MSLDPKHLLLAPNGSHDFGFVDAASAAAMGARPGPVRLQRGYPGKKGYGNLHVETVADRMSQLAQIGYGRFVPFAYDVCQAYGWVARGNRPDRYLLVERRMCGGHRFDLRVIVEPDQRDGEYYYNIVTGLFSPIERSPVICEVTRTGGSVPAPNAAERPRFEALSLPKTLVGSGGNGP